MEGTRGSEPPGRSGSRGVANDRFKARSSAWFWGSVGIASILHFLFFTLGPAMTISGPGKTGSHEVEYVHLPKAELPPPPERIRQPEAPLVAELTVPEDFDLEPVTFGSFKFAHIPPPPAASTSAGGRPDFRDFAPYMVEPMLVNRDRAKRELERRYPRSLRAMGIGAQVIMWFWIDEEGQVADYEIKESSGYRSLDRAAEDLAEILEFTPALHGARPVAVMVALPIRFRIR